MFELAVLGYEFVMRERSLRELLGKPHFYRFPNGSLWFILDFCFYLLSGRAYFGNKMRHMTTGTVILRSLGKLRILEFTWKGTSNSVLFETTIPNVEYSHTQSLCSVSLGKTTVSTGRPHNYTK